MTAPISIRELEAVLAKWDTIEAADIRDIAGDLTVVAYAVPALLRVTKAAFELFAMTVDEDSDDATMELMNSRKRAMLDALKAIHP